MGLHIGHKNGIENKDKEIKPRLKKDKIKCKKKCQVFPVALQAFCGLFFFLLGWDRPEKDGKK